MTREDLLETYPEALEDCIPLVRKTEPETEAFAGVFAKHEELPDWLSDVLSQIEGLRNLPPNWDSYGAVPVDPRSISAAREVIARLARYVNVGKPAVGATPDGDVGFSWDVGDWSIDADIAPSGRISYVYLDERDHVNDEDTWTNDPCDLLHLLTQW